MTRPLMETRTEKREPSIEEMVLVDSPLDGIAEELGWVPVAMADTPEKAVEVMTREIPTEEATHHYIATGARSFHRPAPFHYARLDDGLWFCFEEGGPEEHDGRAGVAREYLPWEKCSADTPGAVEFWDIELAEREAPSA